MLIHLADTLYKRITCLCLLILGKYYWDEATGKYWTAGRKATADGEYKWHLPQGALDVQSATTLRFAQDAISAGGNDCLEVRIKDESAPDSAVLSNDDCEAKKKFICEVKSKKS
jgi:hypothetical protein